MTKQISLTAHGAELRLYTPYDRAFLADFKRAVPSTARRWTKPYWTFDPTYGDQVQRLVTHHYGVTVQAPVITDPHPMIETRAIRLDYLGRCKDRGEEKTAYGFSHGDWNISIPEPVLRAWFKDEEGSQTPPTLYAVLGIAPEDDQAAIKRAFRRLVLQWHPDKCTEPDAPARFQRINHAYQVLHHPRTRKKYDAGLALQASQPPPTPDPDAFADDTYRSPLRCGLVLAQGYTRLGRFVMTTILDWHDITDAQGRTMMVSWPVDADMFEIDWIAL